MFVFARGRGLCPHVLKNSGEERIRMRKQAFALSIVLGLSLSMTTRALAAPSITELFGFPCNTQTLLCADGRDPVALFQSKDGNFYGLATVSQNINRVSRGGTIFKITSSGQFTLLFTF